MSEIPKVIHYCWFGGNKLPKSAQKCMSSWKKYLPDYEIKEWNESNFDFNCCPYAKEAYDAKKWAFVSDFARFKILYEEGGVYFDTDVEIIKFLQGIIDKGAFMGRQDDYVVAPGLGVAASRGNHIIGELLDLYYTLHFKNEDGSLNLKTIVQYTTELLEKHGLDYCDGIQEVEGINIYPKDYFSPKDPIFKTLTITKNTYTIHHFDGTWLPRSLKMKKKIQYVLGNKITNFIVKLKSIFKRNKNAR